MRINIFFRCIGYIARNLQPDGTCDIKVVSVSYHTYHQGTEGSVAYVREPYTTTSGISNWIGIDTYANVVKEGLVNGRNIFWGGNYNPTLICDTPEQCGLTASPNGWAPYLVQYSIIQGINPGFHYFIYSPYSRFTIVWDPFVPIKHGLYIKVFCNQTLSDQYFNIRKIYSPSTLAIDTSAPTIRPTRAPTATPTFKPSCRPSSQPSRQPSRQPSSQPSVTPSKQPFVKPTSMPRSKPSSCPSLQ
jgi:hypothetical protein